MNTRMCVRCLEKKAKIWSGHVIAGFKNGRRITYAAGWCSKRCKNQKGFVGHYLLAMGEK